MYEKDNDGRILFKDPQHLAVSPDLGTIYVTDLRNETVTALTQDGHVLGVVKDKDNLRCPRGITVDYKCRVYVCCWLLHTVCLVSPETGTVTRLLGEEDGMEMPHSVAVCDKTRRLYVGMFGSNVIKVFEILK